MKALYLDVSSYQNSDAIDYKRIVEEGGVEGVIIKIGFTGYGTAKTKRIDSMFQKHYDGFHATGVPIGVYWYSCAYSEQEAIEEAKKTLEFLGDRKLQLPIFFDTEDNHDVGNPLNHHLNQRMLGADKLTKIVRAYCDHILANGYKVGVYSYVSWLNKQVHLDQLRDYIIWVAHYGVDKPSIEGYAMWQYTSDGRLPGYSDRLDLNWCYEDLTNGVKEHLKTYSFKLLGFEIKVEVRWSK